MRQRLHDSLRQGALTAGLGGIAWEVAREDTAQEHMLLSLSSKWFELNEEHVNA